MGTCKRNQMYVQHVSVTIKKGGVVGRATASVHIRYVQFQRTHVLRHRRSIECAAELPPPCRAGREWYGMHACPGHRSAPQTAQIKALAIDNGPVVPLTVACRCQAASAS